MQTFGPTNIILQGLPKDIYSLINHYIDAKDIWDNVKILLEGSELTKEDRESQLYDDFEHFRQNNGETIHSYYVRFAKSSMTCGHQMTMSKIQMNSKFAKHEAHANENKMMLERLTQQTVDPLALMSNVSHQPYHSQSSTNPPNTYHQPHSADTSQSDLGVSPTENLIEKPNQQIALLTQQEQWTWYSAREQELLVMGENRTGMGNANQGYARQMLLMQAQENGVILDEEQSLFLAGGLDNAIDEDVDEQPVQDLALNVDNVFQADDCDAEHEMHDDVQPNHVVDSHADYTSDSNMTPYDQYVNETL
ncbi:hypothetical protein Tco_0839520 [Tanacetum coccineum]|uniref:Integrase, catalytic region, zinc finger, CCHC-type, peptidase aspartic, catalytic n=1 Tax=Tanacetum coccineum TaxID=301880 RepID=A0ABQ5AUZ5_9ASTR